MISLHFLVTFRVWKKYNNKVFSEAYGLVEDHARDEAISERLRSLSFLTEEHIGVPPLVASKVCIFQGYFDSTHGTDHDLDNRFHALMI